MISIASAAKQFNVSRRTIERWIRDGLLTSEVSMHDRRVRLVEAAEIEALVAQRSRPKVYRLDDPDRAGTGVTNNGHEEPNDQDIIDTALQHVYSRYHRLLSQLHPPAFKPIPIEDLREGPLGQDLKILVDLAQGKQRRPKKRVLIAVEAILQLLFWPAAADDYTVPWKFWDTDLGRLLGRVKRQAYDLDELMSIGDAARALGVSRGTVYDWLRDRTLDFVPDDATGRTLVVRRSVDVLRRTAAEFAESSIYERGEVEGDEHAARPVAAVTE